jgi:hypothetical protein
MNIVYMSHFQKIVNPETGRKVSIYSVTGIKVLNKYQQLGGAGTTTKKWSSYSCVGYDKNNCNSQPNNRCKWSEKGKFCRKTQSSSKKRGKKNWGLFKNLKKEETHKKTIANVFSQEGRFKRERQEKIMTIKQNIIDKENDVNTVQVSLRKLAEELGDLKSQLNQLESTN